MRLPKLWVQLASTAWLSAGSLKGYPAAAPWSSVVQVGKAIAVIDVASNNGILGELEVGTGIEIIDVIGGRKKARNSAKFSCRAPVTTPVVRLLPPDFLPKHQMRQTCSLRRLPVRQRRSESNQPEWPVRSVSE